MEEQLQEYEEEFEKMKEHIEMLENQQDQMQQQNVSVHQTPKQTPSRQNEKIPIVPNSDIKLNDREDTTSMMQEPEQPDENAVTPEQQIIELKKRIKKDEANRKKWQEVVKSKDDSIKLLKQEIELLNLKIQEEGAQRKRITNASSQKENKITVLNTKLEEFTKKSKQQDKRIKELETQIQELEKSNKNVKKVKIKEPEDAPKLFGNNEDALIDALYAPLIPSANPKSQQRQIGVMQPDGNIVRLTLFNLYL